MRKILPLLLSLLFSIYSFGQGLNFEKGLNSDYNQNIAGITVFQEFTYVVENVNHSNSFNSEGYIYKFDTLGNEVWKIEVLANSVSEVIKINSIIETEEGGVLINGVGSEGCDFGDFYAFTEEYDLNGLVLWSETHQDVNFSFGSLSCLYKSDSSIIFSIFNTSQNSKVYFHNSTLGVDSLELSSAPILGANQITDSTFLARTSDSLFEYNFQGILLNTKTFGHNIKGLEKITNDSIIVLTSDSLFILNSSFQNLFSGSYNSYNSYDDLKIINGKVFFTASTPQIRWLINLENNFQIENSIGIPYDGNFNELELDYSMSHFSLGVDFSLTNFQSIRMIDYSLSRNTDFFINNMNVSVIDVRINQASTQENSSSDSLYAVNLNVDVLVNNNSTSLVTECRINSYLGNAICNERYFTELKTGLSIASNTSVWVPLGWIGEGDYSMFQNGINYIKCFYTSNPNGVVDLNVSNDSYCKSGIAGYVLLDENREFSLSLYPNPVQDFLYLASKSNIEEVSIYLVNGKLIKKVLKGNIIDVSYLENGVYLIEVNISGKKITQKFVKSNL